MKERMTYAELRKLTLYELGEIALADLEACEKGPGFQVDMDAWLDRNQGVCVGCLAGSVLYQRCGRQRLTTFSVPDWMVAINSLRVGFVNLALKQLGRPCSDLPDYDITPYSESAKLFKKGFRAMLDDLKEKDL